MTEEIQEAQETIYASRNAPTLHLGKFQFKSGVYKTSDPDEIAFLDGLIETKPSVSQLVYKVDREAALKIAEAHQQQQKNAAVKGSMSSADLKAMEASGANAELAKVQADAMTEPVIPKEKLAVTEEGVVEHNDDPDFIADAVPAEVAPEGDAAPAKTTVDILGKKKTS